MYKKIEFILLLCCLSAGNVVAQSDDFGMWYELEAQKKLSAKWNASLGAEFRTRDDSKTTDRWSASVDVDYKLLKTSSFGMKASAGYSLLYDNNPEKLTFKSDGVSPKKWTPSYWGMRHRVNVSLTGNLDLGRWTLGLRERYQYTIRPEKSNQRYAFIYDDDDYLVNHELQPVKSKKRGMLRSRLQLGYNISHCKVDPVASVEMFSDDYGIQKMRYQIGAEWKLTKQHTLSLTYRYQDVGADDDDNEVNSHLIGLGYKFKF